MHDRSRQNPVSVLSEEAHRWIRALNKARTKGCSSRTARQDGLEAGVASSHAMAKTDERTLNADYEISHNFEIVSAHTDIPVPILEALSSRESRCGAVLDNNGWGDGGNAFGILQVDKRYHTVNGLYPTDVHHVRQAAGIFMRYLAQIETNHPDWGDSNLLKGACVAYNSGVRNVRTIANMNLGTTGDDYGDDVIARAQYFLSTKHYRFLDPAPDESGQADQAPEPPKAPDDLLPDYLEDAIRILEKAKALLEA